MDYALGVIVQFLMLVYRFPMTSVAIIRTDSGNIVFTQPESPSAKWAARFDYVIAAHESTGRHYR